MCKVFVLRNSLLCVTFLILFVVGIPIPSYAQAKVVGSADRIDTPSTPTTSQPSTYTDPSPAPSYIPRTIPADFCLVSYGDVRGCKVVCEVPRADGTCKVIQIHVYLENAGSGRTTKEFSVVRKDGESSEDFNTRVNLESIEAALRTGANPNSAEMRAVLLSAVANGKNEIARRLISAGTMVDYMESGRVLLGLGGYMPREERSKRILELLKLGVNVDARIQEDYDSGWYRQVTSPLTQAINNRDLEVVQALLNAKADLKPGRYINSMPLLLAIQIHDKSRLELVKMLLAAGADPDSAPRRENSDDDVYNAIILTGCATSEDIEVVKLLLVAGANPNYRFYSHSEKEHITLLTYFKNQSCPYKNQVISLLKQHGAK